MDNSLVTRSFGREYFRTFPEAIRREWVITNGIGGYAGSSLIGANTRKHHGLLTASFHAPTDRRVLLNRIGEAVISGERRESFSSVQRKGHKYENGFRYQTGFSFDCVPTYSYFISGLSVTKTVAMEYGKNTVAILYELVNEGSPCVLELTPVFNYRDHNGVSRRKDLKFDVSVHKSVIELCPGKAPEVSIKLFASEGVLVKNDEDGTFDSKIELQTEIDTGCNDTDTGFSPYRIELGINSGERKKISVICSIEDSYEKDASITVEKARKRAKKLVKEAGVSDPFLKSLTIAADNFITYRASTNGKTILAGLPWFTDWGRDTMIAFTGLTLETKRFEEAKSILETFTRYEKNGILPNMFPDANVAPLYNTADASLWYFYGVQKYLEYLNTPEAYDFVFKTIYPCLKRVIKAYSEGTDFSIHMDKDGLIHAGSDLDQVTWMDVRIDGYVVTPRHGKPVEINALWYNALVFTAGLSERFGEKTYAESLRKMAYKTKDSFNRRFWNENAGCLYDVVDEHHEGSDEVSDNESIRPNQIFAVSLPYTMLDRQKERAVVKTVIEKLYTDFGLRTLPEEDPDYHGVYIGALHDRDMAYHQGTAWAFPLGGLITAYVKVNDYSKEAIEFAYKLLEPMKSHLNDGCIGGIAEIFDADAPHISRGCYSQAWSVGEIMRSYAELSRL